MRSNWAYLDLAVVWRERSQLVSAGTLGQVVKDLPDAACSPG
ncbi:MAG: hypothetical protein QE280_12990 [Caulobacter sp.]|nr:hypothetical protein [Caulobacter sp.]